MELPALTFRVFKNNNGNPRVEKLIKIELFVYFARAGRHSGQVIARGFDLGVLTPDSLVTLTLLSGLELLEASHKCTCIYLCLVYFLRQDMWGMALLQLKLLSSLLLLLLALFSDSTKGQRDPEVFCGG